MNKIILLGNMTREPRTTRKKNEEGKEVVITKFDLAVNRNNNREAEADFFHCTSFGRQAEFVERYFHKGSRVLVIGRVQNNNYTTKDGDKVYGFSIITEEVEFAQKKSAGKEADRADGFSKSTN
jgi:single-strand DNA-binding protein